MRTELIQSQATSAQCAQVNNDPLEGPTGKPAGPFFLAHRKPCMEHGLTQPLLGIIAFLVGLMVAVTGWIGKRIFERMDKIQEILREAEKDIHVRIDDHEHRITRVESYYDIGRRKNA